MKNVVAGMRFKPEKIVFIGFKEIMRKKKQDTLTEFFAKRIPGIKIEFEYVGRYEFQPIADKLISIVDKNEDCCFDLTGGTELVLTAMGAVSAMRDVPMFQINVRTGNLIRVKNCENLPENEKQSMTIEESIALSGGAVIKDEPEDFEWDLNSEFKKDIEAMWNICKVNCIAWNRQCNTFEAFDKKCRSCDSLAVCTDINQIKESGQEVYLNRRVIEELKKKHLLTEYTLDGDTISFRYKNEQVRRCLIKAGNILELYVYMCAREIMEDEPGFYDDADIGVFIDWDGEPGGEANTKNEIDVMVMRDMVPMFISCKNGGVTKEALYELATVTEKFGGEFGEKVLISTYVSMDSDSRKYIIKRAHDMNIELIDDVDDMTKEEFIAELKKRVK